MARLGRNPVQPGRVTAAVFLGTIGLFIVSMGAGMQKWPFAAAGAAMLIVAVALLTTASVRSTDKTFVSGTVTVAKVSDPPLNTEYGRCEMQVNVDAPGHPGQIVVVRDPKVPVNKWPSVGDTLPALVAAADPRRVRIQWDRVGAYGAPYGAEFDGDRYDDGAYDSETYGDDPYADQSYGGTYDSAYLGNDDYEVDPDYGAPLKTDELPHKTAELPVIDDYDPHDTYPTDSDLDDSVRGTSDRGNSDRGNSDRGDPDSGDSDRGDSDSGAKPEPPAPEPPPSTLPRRQPAPAPSRSPVAVLEGELVEAEVPVQRARSFDQQVDVLDFSSLPEPAAARAGAVAASIGEESGPKVIITQPNARPASAGSIHGVGYTVLVTDLDVSVRFYRDMLGFYEIDDGPETVILASGDTRVVLVTAPELTPVKSRLVHLNLEVGDVDAVYQELKVRGVRFTYPPRVVNRGERLELVAAAFKDPDGHGIAITQWKARTT